MVSDYQWVSFSESFADWQHNRNHDMMSKNFSKIISLGSSCTKLGQWILHPSSEMICLKIKECCKISKDILIFVRKKSVANFSLKFIDSEKATKFSKISTLLLSYVVPVKSKVEIAKFCGLLRIYELDIFCICDENRNSF